MRVLALLALVPIPGSLQETARLETQRTYELDLERARAIGWGRADASPQEVLPTAAGLLERRLRAIDVNFEVRPDAPGPRLVVVRSPGWDEAEGRALDALVRSAGVLEFAIVAEVGRAHELGIELAAEEEKLRRWSTEHPEFPPAAFDALRPEDGGPQARLSWSTRKGDGPWINRRIPLLLPTAFDEALGAADVERAYPSRDNLGFPAVGFVLRRDRARDFGAFTRKNAGRRMAIVLDGEVPTAPNIEEELPGEGILRGEFGEDQVEPVIQRIRGLAGPFRPAK